MEKNILLTIEYDGTRFSGWQIQPRDRTVQGVLEAALERVLRQPVRLEAVSRTDAGVHALGQRATLRGDFGIPTDRLPMAVDRVLRGRAVRPGENADVRILAAEEMPRGFHARFDAVGKTYRYLIRNAGEMPVFLRNYRYQVDRPLDLDRMRAAAAGIVGTHDFACFQAQGSYPRETTVRTVTDLRLMVLPAADLTGAGTADGLGPEAPAGAFGNPGPIPAAGPEAGGQEGPARPDRSARPAGPCDIALEVTGDGFLYNMVRIIAGTLVDVGLGRMSEEDLPAVIAGRDRARAGHTAPPQGLYLKEVYYDRARMPGAERLPGGGDACPAGEGERGASGTEAARWADSAEKEARHE